MKKKVAKKKTAKKKKKKKKAVGTGVVLYQPQNIVKETGVQVAGLLGTLMQFMKDKTIDIAKMREASSLIVELMALQAKQAYNTAMMECQNAIPPITRDKKAPNWHYVSLEKMHRITKPIIHSYGFGLSFGTEPAEVAGKVRLVCDCIHSGGHVHRYTAPDIDPDTKGPQGGDVKTNPQGAASSMSLMQRHMTKLIFNVTIEGIDTDGVDPNKTISEEQEDTMLRLMTTKGFTHERVLTFASTLAKFEIADLPSIPASIYARVMKKMDIAPNAQTS